MHYFMFVKFSFWVGLSASPKNVFSFQTHTQTHIFSTGEKSVSSGRAGPGQETRPRKQQQRTKQRKINKTCSKESLGKTPFHLQALLLQMIFFGPILGLVYCESLQKMDLLSSGYDRRLRATGGFGNFCCSHGLAGH